MKPTNTSIADRLRQQFAQFKPAERKIANHLLADYPMSGLVSITELSKASKVSTPTVMRTLKRIGFTSFVDFQKALKQELSQTLADPVARHGQWASGAPREHVLNRHAEAVLANLQDTMKQISHRDFNAVVDLLADPERSVHLVGGRITHAFSDYLATHLEVIRRGVFTLPQAVSLWSHHLLDMDDGDVLVIFDVRRYEADLLTLAGQAADKGLRVVLFSDQWLSPIARRADFCFPVRIEAPSGWDSGVATLFLVEALINAVECKVWPQAEQRIKALEETFNRTGRFRPSEPSR